MSEKITLYKVAEHKGWRCQKQLNKLRFVKDFTGTKPSCEKQAREWWEDLKLKYRDHWSKTKSWAFFRLKWNEWAPLETLSKKPLAARTVKEYNWAFDQAERLIRPLRYLAEITLENLRLARGVLEAEARQKGTDNYGVNKFVTCMRASLSWAADQGYMKDLILDNFHTLNTAEVQIRTQEVAEIELALKYATPKERVFILLGFDCGLRPEEIANLLWEKLNLETRFGWISPNEKEDKRGIRKWIPKRGKTRQFRITLRLLAELKKLTPKSPYVVENQYGEGYSQQGISVAFSKIVKRINDVLDKKEKDNPIRLTGTCKTLRKDYSTTRQGMGAEEKMVSKSMGHADTKVTKKHYTDQQSEMLRQKMEEEERQRLLELEKYEVPLNY